MPTDQYNISMNDALLKHIYDHRHWYIVDALENSTLLELYLEEYNAEENTK